MDINPGLIQGSIIYNLLDKHFVRDYVKTVSMIRFCLSSTEEGVGPFKECDVHDENEPIFKLTIWAKSRDATIDFETHFLIDTNDGNSYWFFAGGRWRRCSDSNDTGVRLLGPVGEANFNSKKEGFVVEEIGPGTIYEALQGFADENGNWERHFRLLSFMFLDAARFNTVIDFVIKTFKAASDVKTHKQTVDDVVAKCPAHWKNLSKAMHNLFPHYSLEKRPFWDLPPSVVVDLQLPTDEVDKEVTSGEPDKDDIIRAERLRINQIAACMGMINVLCPRRFLVFDD